MILTIWDTLLLGDHAAYCILAPSIGDDSSSTVLEITKITLIVDPNYDRPPTVVLHHKYGNQLGRSVYIPAM